MPWGALKSSKNLQYDIFTPKGAKPPKIFCSTHIFVPRKCVFNIKQKSFPPKNVFYPLTLKPGNGPATHGSCRTKQIKQF